MARQRDLTAHQERISAATWSVLAEAGLPGLTLRAVAARAGCSTGLLLHTFPDKRALLLHARDLLHQRTAARADALEATGAAPEEVLRALLHQAVALGPEQHEEARVWIGFLAAALAEPELAERHVRGNRSFLRRTTRLLAACRLDWDPARCTRAATGLVALVEGLNVLAAADPATYSPDAQRHALDDALDRLVGAAGPVSPP
ncbi:AcrR family transcriptional regulator [Kineococcus xinjiangensis]|uniref:AcrR family transcriptional regulator n=1 Tax=Kineococcus xinjiangensis TaxID=512762 RepID=A0A2S6IMJ5_9ACTN|nr:TetR/AcrR family transcriptional regulator [Kineococcus xinjiangensis]PPK95360.1 AcrR family transcriptional regulator [Kineococcus xinjiangensis]